MVVEIESNKGITNQEVYVPEFGLISLEELEFDKHKFQGRLYRISGDQVKTIAEAIGFASNFDQPGIRTAFVDLREGQGRIVFEIDRNLKPTDLGLRYMRDRWSTSAPQSKLESLRPWIKTEYQARALPDNVNMTLAENMRIKPEEIEKFYIRINLKEKTYSLLADSNLIESLPTGAFNAFALPDSHSIVITTKELGTGSNETGIKQQTQAASRPAYNADTTDGARYATYSRSEVDRLLKQQAETITNNLASKISTYQRTLQEAITNQEKTITRLTDKFATEFETSRTKLEGNTKVAQEGTKAELEQFKNQLAKELSEHRAQFNKAVLPVAKLFEEKPVHIKQQQPSHEGSTAELKAFLVKIVLALVVLIVGSSALVCLHVSNQTGNLQSTSTAK